MIGRLDTQKHFYLHHSLANYLTPREKHFPLNFHVVKFDSEHFSRVQPQTKKMRAFQHPKRSFNLINRKILIEFSDFN